MIPLSHYMIVSAILFALGVAGFLFKRNILTILMSVELMLNAVNLTLVALSYTFRKLDGQVFVIFVLVVAAAEAVVGLAIILAVFRNRGSLNVDDMNQLKF
jgi:NADH-quinone oxidoreductase subunit K